ncbi:hypothetical protein [Rhodovulum sp.]|nr:hypothetical protein [Rhodovulum sp.]
MGWVHAYGAGDADKPMNGPFGEAESGAGPRPSTIWPPSRRLPR